MKNYLMCTQGPHLVGFNQTTFEPIATSTGPQPHIRNNPNVTSATSTSNKQLLMSFMQTLCFCSSGMQPYVNTFHIHFIME